MTTAADEPLRALPPLDQKARFAWLIGAGIAARKTLDRALSVPRRALGYVIRAGAAALARVTPRPVKTALMWLAEKAAAAVPVLRAVGPVTSAVVALTMPPVQRLVTRALGWLGRLVGRALRATWRAVDASLRFFGDSGAAFADRLTEKGTALAARVSSVAASPQVQIVAGAGVSVLQLVRPLARVLAIHRLVRLLVPQWWLRWLLEGAVAPFLIDGRLSQVVRTRLESGLVRLAATPVVPVATAGPAAVIGVESVEVVDGDLARQVDVPPVLPFSDDVVAVPTDNGAFNRAERREQQRQQAQAKRKRPARTTPTAT